MPIGLSVFSNNIMTKKEPIIWCTISYRAIAFSLFQIIGKIHPLPAPFSFSLPVYWGHVWADESPRHRERFLSDGKSISRRLGSLGTLAVRMGLEPNCQIFKEKLCQERERGLAAPARLYKEFRNCWPEDNRLSVEGDRDFPCEREEIDEEVLRRNELSETRIKVKAQNAPSLMNMYSVKISRRRHPPNNLISIFFCSRTIFNLLINVTPNETHSHYPISLMNKKYLFMYFFDISTTIERNHGLPRTKQSLLM